MKKRFMSAGMAAVVAMASLTACGGSASTETTAADAKAETSAEAGESSAEAGIAEGGTLKIGVIGPLTGAAAS